MPGIYGGDDVSAIVLDPGSSTIRAGWAGEDTPRALLPNYYGWFPASSEEVDAQIKTAGDAVSTSESDPDAMEGVESTTTKQTGETSEGQNGDANDGERKEGENGATGEGSTSRKKLGLSDWEVQKIKSESRRRYVGDSGVNLWRKGMEIASPLEDSVVTSSASLLALSRFGLSDTLGADASEHPLLLTEPSWNPREAREELTELAFEGLGVPAFYLANSTVLSSFSAGKPTSLIVDVGSSHSSAIPVVDGFILRKGIQRQAGVGGDCISRALLYDFANPPSLSARSGGAVDVIPQYLVMSKSPVQPGQASLAKLREERRADTPESFHTYHKMRTLHDAKENLSMVLDVPWDDAQAHSRSSKIYEFPDGYNDIFGIERYRASEVLFTPQLWASAEGVLPPAPSTHFHKPVPDLIMEAIEATDVDSRATLLQNIVCVGGGSNITGFNDRLSYELGLRAPGQKIKIHSPGNVIERRYSSWLGGSILASLGTFHQLWISRQEYEEHGNAIVHARCR